MRILYFSIPLFLFSIANGQNEFYISGDNNSSTVEVFIDSRDGSNPTLFVAGEIVNNNGILINNGGRIEVTGNFTNTANGTDAYYQSSGEEIFSGAGDITISGTLNGTSGNINQFNDVILRKNAEITLDNSVNIGTSGKLEFDLSSVIKTGANELFVRNTSAAAIVDGNLTGATNFVEGRLRRATDGSSTYVFPIGFAGYGAQGFTMSNLSGANGAQVLGFLESNSTAPLQAISYCDLEATNGQGVQVGDGLAGFDGILDLIEFNLQSPLQWNITNPAGGTITNYDVTVSANGLQDIAPVVTSNGVPVRYLMKNGEPGNTGVPTGPGLPSFTATGFLACPNQYTLAGMTSFSSFTINGVTKSNTLLPVTYLNFTARGINNQYIQVSWATATEINNSGFFLQRSVDGINFESITWVDGNGNSTVVNQYGYQDFGVEKNIVYYYRLVQIDFDATENLSPIVNARLNGATGQQMYFGLYPNPTNDEFNVDLVFFSESEKLYTVYVYDMQGKLVFVRNIEAEKGANKHKLESGLLADGTYFVKLLADVESATHKLVVAR